MEEFLHTQSTLDVIIEDDDEVYEKIEAPKFVDFTVPDPPPPLDDRSWFCLRVGCDLKHEEDMDPEALYKRFVLRVMAARSPNLRLRKALSRHAPSGTTKCPLSAPAKSSKRRVSRLAAITSLSQKMADAKVKLHPISKMNLTPSGKLINQSSVAAKALTTPRNKKCIPKIDPFRSVQNPKTAMGTTRSRVVAKALVFNSPKKDEKKTTSLECQKSVSNICSEMKKLEINTQKKECCKPSSCSSTGSKKRATSSKPVKSRLFNHIQKSGCETTQECKDKETKSVRRPKRKSRENTPKFLNADPQEGPDNDLSDMEIDEKSRYGSLDVCTAAVSSKGNEEHLVSLEENLGATTATEEEFSTCSEATLGSEIRQTVSMDVATDKCTMSNSEIDKEEMDTNELRIPDRRRSEINEHEECVKSNVEEEEKEKDFKENHAPMLQPSETAGEESEAMLSDDKENASASDDNRESNMNPENYQRIPSNHESHDQKVNGKVVKTLRGCNTLAAAGSVSVKYKKAKPTNPKPFRLRTDERGILREAMLEKKLAPLREITQISKVPEEEDAQRSHGNEIQREEKSHGRYKHGNDSKQSNQTEMDERIPRQRHSYLKSSKHKMEQKMATTTIQKLTKKLEDGVDKAAKNLERRTTAKSPLLRQQLVKPQSRVVRTRTATVLATPGGLTVIKERSATVLRPNKDANKPVETVTSTTTTKTALAIAGRSSSRGKRPTTVPREPHFHKIHTPRNCTKTPTKAIPSS